MSFHWAPFKPCTLSQIVVCTHFRVGSGFARAILCHCAQGFARFCMNKSCFPQFCADSRFTRVIVCHCVQGYARFCMLKSCCPCCPHSFAPVHGLPVSLSATVYEVSRESACRVRVVHISSRRFRDCPCDSLTLSLRCPAALRADFVLSLREFRACPCDSLPCPFLCRASCIPFSKIMFIFSIRRSLA